jgi:hypothetical protein
MVLDYFCGYGCNQSNSTIHFDTLRSTQIIVWIDKALIHYVFDGRSNDPNINWVIAHDKKTSMLVTLTKFLIAMDFEWETQY